MFEITSPQSYIIEKPNLERLRFVRDSWSTARSGWLDALVRGDTFHTDSAMAYSGAYVLTWYLVRAHPGQFAAFLKRVRAAGAATSTGRVAEFEAGFGMSLPAMEREMLQFLRNR